MAGDPKPSSGWARLQELLDDLSPYERRGSPKYPSEWALFREALALGLSRVRLFRKPLTTPWRVGIGVFSVVTILVVYTLLSWYRHLDNPDDRILPTWSQLWTEGVVPSLTPERVDTRPLTGEEQEAISAAGSKILTEELVSGQANRVEVQKARLTSLAESPTSERIRQEVLRARAVGFDFANELTPTQQERLKKAEEDALGALPSDVRTKAEQTLKKIQDEAARDEDRRNVYRIRLWDDIKATFGRFALGLGVAVLVSLALGLLMGCYSFIDAYFYPPLAFLAKIPGTAVTALFMVLVGLDANFYLSLILFGLIPTLTMTFYVYTKEVPEELIYKARTLGASQAECIFSVIVPNILPKVVETIRLSVGPALIFLYAAEMIYGNIGEGLGCTLRLMGKKGVTYMPVIYFYLVVIACLGFALDWALRFSQKKLFPWYYPE